MSRKPLFWLDKVIKKDGNVASLMNLISDVSVKNANDVLNGVIVNKVLYATTVRSTPNKQTVTEVLIDDYDDLPNDKLLFLRVGTSTTWRAFIGYKYSNYCAGIGLDISSSSVPIFINIRPDKTGTTKTFSVN